jgi:hypothetical protein
LRSRVWGLSASETFINAWQACIAASCLFFNEKRRFTFWCIARTRHLESWRPAWSHLERFCQCHCRWELRSGRGKGGRFTSCRGCSVLSVNPAEPSRPCRTAADAAGRRGLLSSRTIYPSAGRCSHLLFQNCLSFHQHGTAVPSLPEISIRQQGAAVVTLPELSIHQHGAAVPALPEISIRWQLLGQGASTRRASLSHAARPAPSRAGVPTAWSGFYLSVDPQPRARSIRLSGPGRDARRIRGRRCRGALHSQRAHSVRGSVCARTHAGRAAEAGASVPPLPHAVWR